MERKLRMCSLLSGYGGFDLVFFRAGFEIILAIYLYARACESYILNFLYTIGDHI